MYRQVSLSLTHDPNEEEYKTLVNLIEDTGLMSKNRSLDLKELEYHDFEWQEHHFVSSLPLDLQIAELLKLPFIQNVRVLWKAETTASERGEI